MGVFIGASTKMIDSENGQVFFSEIPPYSAVVPGFTSPKNNISTYCAVIYGGMIIIR